MSADFTTIEREDFTVLAPHPANAPAGYSFAVRGDSLIWSKGELDEYVEALGVELKMILPAVSGKLGDFAVSNDQGGIPNMESSPPQVSQHHSFRVLDVLVWWAFNVGHIKPKYLV